MERRSLHSQLSDPEPLDLDLCRTELTRINSDSSAITVDTSMDVSHHCAAPFPQDQSTKWTDQQHSLYLNSLEVSFVNELHRSLRLRSWSLQSNLKEACKSRTLQNSSNKSGQFLVLQDGCWKKISHERNEPMLESAADSHVLAGSPLRLASVERGCDMRESATHNHDLLCDDGFCTRGSSTFFRRSPRSSGKQRGCRLRYLELVGSTAEVTDQNFKDEDQGARSSCEPMKKRLKTVTAESADASRNDQVVPYGKFCTTDLSTNTNSFSENNGQEELLSELPESSHFPKSKVHYFLRGS